MRCSIILILSCFISYSAYAQSTTALVWEASTSVNYKLSKDWSFNSSLAHRTVWLDNKQFGESGLDVRLAFAELNQFATYIIHPKLKASVGYKYRWLEPTEDERLFEHRITQQIAMIHRTQIIRLSSRFRSEQRIFTRSFAQRLRYRFSIDFPLSGESLDRNEFYFLASNEVTYEIRKNHSNPWGNRITSGLGYLFGDVTKLQLSFTYRTDNFTRQSQNRLFVETGLFFNVRSNNEPE